MGNDNGLEQESVQKQADDELDDFVKMENEIKDLEKKTKEDQRANYERRETANEKRQCKCKCLKNPKILIKELRALEIEPVKNTSARKRDRSSTVKRRYNVDKIGT